MSRGVIGSEHVHPRALQIWYVFKLWPRRENRAQVIGIIKLKHFKRHLHHKMTRLIIVEVVLIQGRLHFWWTDYSTSIWGLTDSGPSNGRISDQTDYKSLPDISLEPLNWDIWIRDIPEQRKPIKFSWLFYISSWCSFFLLFTYWLGWYCYHIRN